MAACRASSRWFFSREQIEATPSRRCGVEADRELSYRQQAANLIQDMGQRLNVSQLTINTAIVYMHRFYMYHSFTRFHRNITSPTTLFLAAKVEEQPRKLEHVIKVAHACLNPQEPPLDAKNNAYLQQAQELVILESIVLQTLGFDITIEHPHTDVVKCSQLVRASKDLAQTSYFMATNSLHLTTFCLQYKPTVIACVCIHLACKWSNWEIPVSTDGKHWWEYVDPTVTLELLDELTHEFLQILEKTPSRLKRIRNWRATQAAKKPKSESQASDGSIPDLSSAQVPGPSLVDSIPGVSASATFPKASASFPVPVASSCVSTLSIDSLPGIQISYDFSEAGSWPKDAAGLEAPPFQHDTPSFLPSNSATPQPFPSGKPEQKAGGGARHPPGTQRMTLDKYREKHAAGRKQDPGAEAPLASLDHRKQPHLQPVLTGVLETSPVKAKLPLPVPDRHLGDKRDKGSLKVRLPVPSGDKGDVGREELKMKIKVSSERHSSSDEGSSRTKHSSPLTSKDKHREHSGQRHHKHGHPHVHSHSGNGRGGPEGTLCSPVGVSGEGVGPGTGPHRKRAHPEAGSHNHHSKTSKSSKSSGSASLCSSVRQIVSSEGSVVNHPFPPPPPPVAYQVGYGHLSTLVKLDRSPVVSLGSEGTGPGANGLQTDYKDTFDMLDSLLSAQGMNS
ncbi:cyclin-T2 isoform X1 [Paramormyrops kingsleyae]|uniref:cyclin-T2 isoform X1 n=1 Tax=Paramormyrops kingsleyae TaxID=1676925 RepID=UPI003B96CF5B